jgi:hypothetical protein
MTRRRSALLWCQAPKQSWPTGVASVPDGFASVPGTKAKLIAKNRYTTTEG